MIKKTILSLAAAGLIAGAILAPTQASAGHRHAGFGFYSPGFSAGIGHGYGRGFYGHGYHRSGYWGHGPRACKSYFVKVRRHGHWILKKKYRCW